MAWTVHKIRESGAGVCRVGDLMEQTNIRLRRFKYKDTMQLTKWGKHLDPRFYHYNFPYSTTSELEAWYRAKKKFLKRWIYAVESSGRVVGYITLKHVKWSKKQGEMGIALNPDYVDQGIGTRAICLYLHRVFRNFALEQIVLKTAEFNTRAISCYEKIGFERVCIKREAFEEQSFRSDILNRFPFFDHDEKTLYVPYYYMRITKAQFYEKYIKKNERRNV